ncbi:hypothetical protein EGW08_004739, partial [Elysia chlorotica]
MNPAEEDNPLISPKKKGQQDLLSELNDVLSIRAEKIRQRLVSERQGETDDVLASTECIQTFEEEHLKALRDDTVTNPATRNPSLIPLPKARLRKQSKDGHKPILSREEKVCAKARKNSQNHDRTISKGSTVNIKNYKPGYTWNKGGRVKELRI